MRVDVHTHVRPEKIAGAVLQSMVRDFKYPPVGEGTLDGIKAHMRESGVDKSIGLT